LATTTPVQRKKKAAAARPYVPNKERMEKLADEMDFLLPLCEELDRKFK